MPDQSIMI